MDYIAVIKYYESIMCKFRELATYDHSKNILKKFNKKESQDYIYFVADYQDL